MESLPEGWAKGMSRTEGVEYYYQTAPGNSSISCWIHPSKHYNLYGDKVFLDKCTDAFAQDISVHARGSYGSVKQVNIDGIPYFVKRMYAQTEPGDKIQVAIRHMYSKHTFMENEITVAVDLTQKIPEYVSNIKGAQITMSPNPVGAGVFYIESFLVFEAPTGMNLYQYLKVLNPEMDAVVYCMVKNAQVALNNAGYVHRDIKPDNIYVIIDASGNPLNCKLIDFGFTVKKGSFVPRVGTPQYTLKEISDHLWVPHEVSAVQNDHSTDVIWTRDFKRDPSSKPTCAPVGHPNANLEPYKSPSNANVFTTRNPLGAPSLRKISSFRKGGRKTYKKTIMGKSIVKRQNGTYKQRNKPS